LGNVRDIDAENVVLSLENLAAEYGPIFTLSFFGRKVIFICSEELVSEVCEKGFKKKLNPPLICIRDLTGDGLFTAYNEEPNWLTAHRILMPAFGPMAIRNMFPSMYDIAKQQVEKWERFGSDFVIDVVDNMTRLTLDTLALCAFNFRFNSFYQKEMHPFIEAMVFVLMESGAR